MKKRELQIICWILRNIQFNPARNSLVDHKIKVRVYARVDADGNIIKTPIDSEEYLYLQCVSIILALHSPSITIFDNHSKKIFKKAFFTPYAKNMTMRKMKKFLHQQSNFRRFWSYMVSEAGIEPT
jgi:hypothetical protein